MSTEPRTSVDALLGRLDRVKSLARRLVRDAAEADDLVQEAVAAALARPTTVYGDGDGWITATLRNLMRDRARREGRRDRREKVAARPEGSGRDTRVLVENAERQRDVVEAVLSLEDPYRETLLMRFFEDLPPREIVKRTGRTPAAVKKHIDRGLAQVRSKLETQYGDRGQWAVALLPVIGTKGLTKLGVAGAGAAIPPSYRLRYSAVLAVVLGIGVPSYVMWRGAGSAGGAPSSTEVARVSIDEESDDALATVADAPGSRATDARPHDDGTHGEHAADAPAIDPAQFFLGNNVRLFDLAGAPIASEEIEWTWVSGVGSREDDAEPYVVTVNTDEKGAAVLRGPSSPDYERGPWLIDGLRFAVAEELFGNNETLLVLAPAVRVAGRVVDPAGEPVPDAEVTVWVNLRAVPTFPDASVFAGGVDDRIGPRTVERTTDARGEFEFEMLPAHPKFQIHVDAKGRRGTRVAMPEVDESDLEIRIGEPLPPQRWISGLVVESTGEPVAGAAVTWGYDSATADDQGRFRIEVPGDPVGLVVAAAASDGRFATEPSPVDSDDVAPTDVDGVVEDAVVLRIPLAMPKLRGRLQDADGEPVSGVDVLLFDGTRIGGNMTFYETGGSYADVVTDDGGAFEIPLCADRPYRLRFVDRETMLVHDSGPLAPGGVEHVVTLPADGYVDVLEGQVLDVYGEPVAGASIRLRARANSPESTASSILTGRDTTTDDEGRFAIERAPWRHLSIWIDPRPRTELPGATVPIGDRRPDGPLTLDVDLHCFVHLTLERDDVQRIEVRTAAGERLNVTTHESGIRSYRRDLRRSTDGDFPLFDVSQRAAELVLIGASGEIDRVPVRLGVSEQNDVVL